MRLPYRCPSTNRLVWLLKANLFMTCLYGAIIAMGMATAFLVDSQLVYTFKVQHGMIASLWLLFLLHFLAGRDNWPTTFKSLMPEIRNQEEMLSR